MPRHSAANRRSASTPPAPIRLPKLLYRAEEAAEVMSLSRTAIFELIRCGDLDTIKIGNRRRIPRSSIEDYVTRQLASQAIADAEFAR